MKSSVEIREHNIINNQNISSSALLEDASSDLNKINRISEILTSEGDESFRHYIEWLGLARDPGLVILSSIHHYYYDMEEMKNVKTLVNLKELNHIREINDFLRLIAQILPPKSFFIGCFIDNRKQNSFFSKRSSSKALSQKKSEAVSNGIISKIPILNMIYSIMDLKTYRYMSAKNVTALLESSGFKVMDMTDLEGLTYFCAQSLRSEDN